MSDDDLTTAWMAGNERGKDAMRARVAELEAALATERKRWESALRLRAIAQKACDSHDPYDHNLLREELMAFDRAARLPKETQ